MKLQSLIYILLLIPFHFWGQTNTAIKDSYKSYHNISNEALHVHLNKTSYFVGEEVWCKGYVLDTKYGEVNTNATNLYVGIYDKNGVRLKNNLCRIENGITRTNILIDSTFTTGTYYIKASTQQMRDTQSAHAFIQEISILGKEIITESPESNSEKKYDIQFLPEGGHLVQNTTHNIGFKAINGNGKGVYVSGIIYDDQNNEVSTFESNSIGIGKIQIPDASHLNYKASITFKDETTIEKQLPEIKLQGITLAVDVTKKDTLAIQFNTNKATLPSIVSKDYTLLIHKDGLVKSMPFSFEGNTTGTISLPKALLFDGINTITLFDGNTPILERMFFNSRKKHGSVVVKNITSDKDSAKFSLYLVKNKSSYKDANVSISILPETTKSYHPAHSILSSYYLRPYLNGAIENPKYYFPNNTRSKKKALDNLLITQGWSKYNWNAIFNDKKASIKPASKGITISGIVNYPIKDVKGVFLYDSKNSESKYLPIDKDRNFTIPNFFPEQGEELRFSYINRKKKFLKPKLFLKYSIIDEQDILSKNAVIDRFFDDYKTRFSLPDNFFRNDSESLFAVVLEGKNKKKEEKRDPILIHGKVTKITEEKYHQFPRVTDFIINSGFDVFEDPIHPGKLYINSRKALTLQRDDNGLPVPLSPLLFVDDVRMSSFDFLRNFSTANVEKIIIDKNGFGYGLGASAGVIKIYTRKTPLKEIKGAPVSNFTTTKVPFGYTKPKEYYVPKYTSFNNRTFEHYGAIDWKPNVNIPRKGSYNLEFDPKGLKNVILFIEGTTKDGALISKSQIINIAEED